MAETLSFLTMGLYFGGTLLFLIFLLHRSEVLSRVAVFVAGAGFLVHTAALGMAIVSTGHVPILTFRDAMSFFAWGLVLVLALGGVEVSAGWVVGLA